MADSWKRGTIIKVLGGQKSQIETIRSGVMSIEAAVCGKKQVCQNKKC